MENQLTNEYYAKPGWYHFIVTVNERIVEDFVLDKLSLNQLKNEYYAKPGWYHFIIPVNERIVEDFVLLAISLSALQADRFRFSI